MVDHVCQGRRWSDGLHQAVEAKEDLPIQNETVTLASISYQNFFLQVCACSKQFSGICFIHFQIFLLAFFLSFPFSLDSSSSCDNGSTDCIVSETLRHDWNCSN